MAIRPSPFARSMVSFPPVTSPLMPSSEVARPVPGSQTKSVAMTEFDFLRGKTTDAAEAEQRQALPPVGAVRARAKCAAPSACPLASL